MECETTDVVADLQKIKTLYTGSQLADIADLAIDEILTLRKQIEALSEKN